MRLLEEGTLEAGQLNLPTYLYETGGEVTTVYAESSTSDLEESSDTALHTAHYEFDSLETTAYSCDNSDSGEYANNSFDLDPHAETWEWSYQLTTHETGTDDLTNDDNPEPPFVGGGGTSGESWVRDNAQVADASFHESGGHGANGAYSLSSYLYAEASHGTLTFHSESYSNSGLGNLEFRS